MKKFTSLNRNTSVKKEKEPIYQDDHLKITEFEDWKIIDQPDVVVAIIYLMDEGVFILRHEYIPTFKFKEGQDYHLTLVGGGIEKGETPEKALFREIEEEAGIVIRDDFQLEFMKPLYLMKGSTCQVHPSLVVLNSGDYHEVIAKGDGSRIEKISKSVKIDEKYITKVNCSDLITQYMLDQLKKYLNMPL
jgi:hypothetical protein